MTAPALNTVAHQLCTWIETRSLAEVSDCQLLERFVHRGEEAAFAALLQRYGPMVLHVCYRVLGRLHDAEDVFQATFMLLARKAKSIRKGEAVGSWLHGVAYRLAVRFREQARRRQAHERRAADVHPAGSSQEAEYRELHAVLDDELQRLPAKYRQVLVLCYLEGQTQDEAARRLGCPLGTVRSRLARARQLFHKRLLRRGLTLATVAATTAPAANTAPAALLHSTLKAALAFAAGPASESLSAPVVSLAENGLQAMAAAKWNRMLTRVLLMIALAAGTGSVTMHVLAEKLVQSKPEGGPPVAAKTPDAPKPATHQGDALPAGAIRRLGSLRFRHGHEPAFWMPTGFSRDGKWLATSNVNIRLWNRATGELVREIDGHYSGALFSPDGKVLAAFEAFVPGDQQALCLLDVATGKILHRLPKASGALAFSPDGKQFVTPADRQNSVRLWDTKSGKPVSVLRGPGSGVVHSAAFTADGRTLITACWDNTVCRWDLTTGELRKSVDLPMAGKLASLSTDGRILAVAQYSNTDTVRLWDTSTGELRCAIQGERNTENSDLTLSPDGKILAIASHEEGLDKAAISLWDTKTGNRIRRIAASVQSVWALRFAPEGQTLLSSGRESCIHLWDVQTGKERFEGSGHRGAVASLAFTPDGRSLVSGAGDGSIRVWDVATGRTRRARFDHHSRLHTILVSPNGKSFLSAGSDHCLRLHDLATGEERRRLSVEKTALKPRERGYQFVALGLASDGRTLATWSTRREDGVFHVWDLATAEIRRSWPAASPQRRCWFSPDARFMLSCNGVPPSMPFGTAIDEVVPRWMPLDPSSLVLQDTTTGRRALALPQPDLFPGTHAFAPDGRSLVTYTGTGRVPFDSAPVDKHALHIWELASGKERLKIAPGHTGWEHRFEQLAVAPNGRMLATIRADRTIQLWDLATGAELLSRRGPSAWAICLAFSPDSRILATGHDDSTILLWDTTAGRPALRGSAEKPDVRQIERWWDDLASEDAHRAYLALWSLFAVPEQALPLLRERLRPAVAVPADKLRRLIEELDSEAFSRRESASMQLAALGEQAQAALEAALKAKPSAERRRRIEALLVDSCRVRSTEVLRSLRAVEVLEQIGSTEACRVLEALAVGAADARLTREAQAALACRKEVRKE